MKDVDVREIKSHYLRYIQSQLNLIVVVYFASVSHGDRRKQQSEPKHTTPAIKERTLPVC